MPTPHSSHDLAVAACACARANVDRRSPRRSGAARSVISPPPSAQRDPDARDVVEQRQRVEPPAASRRPPCRPAGRRSAPRRTGSSSTSPASVARASELTAGRARVGVGVVRAAEPGHQHRCPSRSTAASSPSAGRSRADGCRQVRPRARTASQPGPHPDLQQLGLVVLPAPSTSMPASSGAAASTASSIVMRTVTVDDGQPLQLPSRRRWATSLSSTPRIGHPAGVRTEVRTHPIQRLLDALRRRRAGAARAGSAGSRRRGSAVDAAHVRRSRPARRSASRPSP